jgi:hypothetical protein
LLPALAAAACFVYYLNEKKMVDRLIREGTTDNSGLQSAQLQLRRNLMVGLFIMCESRNGYLTIVVCSFAVPLLRRMTNRRLRN